MTPAGEGYAYGPVPSRRLGKSLGINNIPVKTCSYACSYCQAGRTSRMEIVPRRFYGPEAIVQAARSRLEKARAASEPVDYFAFVPDGEPTLDADLGEELRRLKELGIPVAVITNATLVWQEDVRAALSRADWVSLKVDAARETVWKRINRPHPALSLSVMMEGMLAFARDFSGQLMTETMLVGGVNDQEEDARETAAFLRRLQPRCAYLSVPIRPPAQAGVEGPGAADLNRAYQIFSENVRQVELLTGYEGNAFAFTGDIEQDLLGVTAVHPMRSDAVRALLDRAGASWDAVERLLGRGELVEAGYAGHLFYLRGRGTTTRKGSGA